MQQILMTGVLILGVVFVTVSLTQAYSRGQNIRTVYKYVPRTFIEDQENPIPLDDIFYDMFNNPAPFMASVDVVRRRQDIGENLNKYYITAI